MGRTNIGFLPDAQGIIGVTANVGDAIANELVVVLNWDEELKRRVPVR